jgi:hypothetical protein
MKSFKTFLAEAKKPSGEDWEVLITAAYNGGGFRKNRELLVTRFKKEEAAQAIWEENEKVAKQIAKNLKAKLKGSKMEQFGSSRASVSSFWSQNGGSQPTPKTDMFTNKERISLKKAGGSQLMSGRPGETKATFMAAAAFMGESAPAGLHKFANEVTKEFKSIFTEAPVKDMLDLAKNLKAGLNPKEIEVKGKGTFKVDTALKKQAKDLLEQSLKNKRLTAKIQEFAKDPVFREFVAYEASSGEMKFNGGQAAADLIVVFDDKTGQVAVKPIHNGKWIKDGGSPGPAAVELATKVKFQVSFKSGSGKPGKRDTVLRARLSEEYGFNSLDHIVERAYQDHIGSFESLCESYLHLDESSFLANLKARILNFVRSVVENVGKLLSSLASSGRQAFQSILEFLDIDFSVSSSTTFKYTL